MADELKLLADTLNRLIEQDRFAEAQAMLPEYTRALDRCLRNSGGEEVLGYAMATFQNALAKARIARAHLAAELSDVHRARAYTAAHSNTLSEVQLIG